jgi:hypothetical protein
LGGLQAEITRPPQLTKLALPNSRYGHEGLPSAGRTERDGFWHVGNYCARDDQIAFLAFIAEWDERAARVEQLRDAELMRIARAVGKPTLLPRRNLRNF